MGPRAASPSGPALCSPGGSSRLACVWAPCMQRHADRLTDPVSRSHGQLPGEHWHSFTRRREGSARSESEALVRALCWPPGFCSSAMRFKACSCVAPFEWGGGGRCCSCGHGAEGQPTGACSLPVSSVPALPVSAELLLARLTVRPRRYSSPQFMMGSSRRIFIFKGHMTLPCRWYGLFEEPQGTVQP